MAFDLGNLLQQYVGGTAPTADTATHFDQVAQNAPPEQLSNGLSAAFHSDATPPFGQMVGQMFDNADPGQRAGMLTNLLHGIGPSVLSSLAAGAGGGGLGAILGKFTQGGGSAATVTPEQAAQVTPEQVEQIAGHAEQHNPGIVDHMSNFYAQHPDLVKTLGGAVLGVAMAKMAERY